jgi:beta-glucosidase
LILKQKFIYLDPSKSLEERINDLVSRLTLDEKISQLLNDAIGIERLEIPKYNWWSEALHGVGFSGIATVFPQAIGLAASFDLDLMYRVASAISDEGRAKHHEAVRNNQRKIFQGLTFWSPNVNIFRDPRWGRGQETYGEDPFLTSQMGVTFIKGLQGDNPKYLKVVATPKHYIAYSGLESERHEFNAIVSKKDLYETYLPAFEACIKEGKAEAIMGAYNRVNGEPCCGSRFLLDEILRQHWNFKGHVVSDCGAIMDIFNGHKLVGTGAEAAAMALNAGCDLFCCIGIRTKKNKRIRWEWIQTAFDEGLLTERVIDQAVSRLFRARFLLGMFDPPELVPYNSIPFDLNDCEEHRFLALEAARKSIVLLKNENKLLPLNKTVKNVAVIGPTADNLDVLLGNYHGTPSKYITILQGINERISEKIAVSYCIGCPLKERSRDGFNEAIEKGKKSDVIILALGISPRLEGEQGEAVESDLEGDRLDIKLPGSQGELLKELYKLNKPIVLVLTGGSALTFSFAKENIPSILYAWYPGEVGGKAVADVIFGDYNPAGRLPITLYNSINQLPDVRDYSMEGRTYRYFKGDVLYPFGFGLSYTDFMYDSLRIIPQKVRPGEKVTVSIDVKNIGTINGEEIVQLYIKHPSVEFQMPFHELKGFQKIRLNPDQKKTVHFTLDDNSYSIIDMEGKKVTRLGRVIVYVGGCQPNTSFSRMIKEGEFLIEG